MSDAPNNPPTPSPGSDPAGSPAASGDAPAAPVRPDGLPDRFWNAEKGVLTDELVKDASTRHAAEAARAKEIPAGAEHYKVQLGPEFVVPPGMTFKIDEKDPLLDFARGLAAEQKWTQKDFDGVVGKYAAVKLAESQAAAAQAKDEDAKIEADLQTLGATREVRIKAVEDFLSAHTGDAEIAKLFARDLGTSKVINALEKMIQKFAGGGPAVPGNGRESSAPAQTLEERWYGKAA